MKTNQIITKLISVRATTRSAANRQLLTECIDALQEELEFQHQQLTGNISYHVRQRLKLRDDVGIKLTEEGKAMRFLVNTIDEPNQRLWVVDAAGKEKPQWMPMKLVEPAND